VKDSNGVLGGYNPIVWKTYDYGITKDSFIFSFLNKENIKDHIISRVKDEENAINNWRLLGPSFGVSDLILRGGTTDNFKNSENRCKNKSYEKNIRETEDNFFVEEYEVFQILFLTYR
jgi:hypothetical protein